MCSWVRWEYTSERLNTNDELGGAEIHVIVTIVRETVLFMMSVFRVYIGKVSLDCPSEGNSR